MDRNRTLTALAAVLAVCAAAHAEPVTVDRVVAVVNNEIITLSDLQREAQKQADRPDDRALLEELISRKLQMAAAKREGMDATEKDVDDAIADIQKRNNLTQQQFEAVLAKEQISPSRYRAELKEQMSISRVFNKYVRTGIAVTEEEVRSYFDRNRSTFTLAEEIRVRQLFLPVPAGASPAEAEKVRARAEQAAERARGGADLASLVREYGGPGAGDGDLGFMERGQILPEIDQAVAGLAPGGIAGPLRSERGYHVIRLEEVRRPVMSFERVKNEIKKALFEQKTENAYQGWLQNLRNEATIEIRL